MSGMQADLRAAAVALLKSYAQAQSLTLNVYPGRPKTITAPHAFVDAMRERVTYDGLRQRYPSCEIVIAWGLYDSAEAVRQRDAFVDGFLDWFTASPHAANANSVAGVTGIDDLPAYTPDWLEVRTTYYATQITLEGYTG
jgi:hypothetical protein